MKKRKEGWKREGRRIRMMEMDEEEKKDEERDGKNERKRGKRKE